MLFAERDLHVPFWYKRKVNYTRATSSLPSTTRTYIDGQATSRTQGWEEITRTHGTLNTAYMDLRTQEKNALINEGRLTTEYRNSHMVVDCLVQGSFNTAAYDTSAGFVQSRATGRISHRDSLPRTEERTHAESRGQDKIKNEKVTVSRLQQGIGKLDRPTP